MNSSKAAPWPLCCETLVQFPAWQILNLLEEAAAVLARQEALGLIHRDIKPSNIFIRGDGSTCIFDYGVVTAVDDGLSTRPKIVGSVKDDATRTDFFVGTPAYLPPEVLHSRPTHQFDLFALGLVAWECAAGRRARAAEEVENFAFALRPRDLPRLRAINPSVPEWLDSFVSHLTAKSPADRYASATQLLCDINNLRYRDIKPVGNPRGRAFVALPFTYRFRSVYNAVASACTELRLRSVRMDERLMLDDIWGGIAAEIEQAAVVIADFSPCQNFGSVPNANVVTEAFSSR